MTDQIDQMTNEQKAEFYNPGLGLTKFEKLVLEQLARIADGYEKNATANAEFQRAIISAFTPLIPAMLAMFSNSMFPPKLPITIGPDGPVKING